MSKNNTSNVTPKIQYARLPNRIKAFIVDMFIIMMPIMYITTYIIMDGKNDFQGSEIARWITSLLFGIIVILFWIKNGQTPGYRAYKLKVVDEKSQESITLPQAILRYIFFMVTAASIIGIFFPFFRKDKKTLYDLLSKSCVINSK